MLLESSNHNRTNNDSNSSNKNNDSNNTTDSPSTVVIGRIVDSPSQNAELPQTEGSDKPESVVTTENGKQRRMKPSPLVRKISVCLEGTLICESYCMDVGWNSALEPSRVTSNNRDYWPNAGGVASRESSGHIADQREPATSDTARNNNGQAMDASGVPSNGQMIDQAGITSRSKLADVMHESDSDQITEQPGTDGTTRRSNNGQQQHHHKLQVQPSTFLDVPGLSSPKHSQDLEEEKIAVKMYHSKQAN